MDALSEGGATRVVETVVVALIPEYHQVKVRDQDGHLYALTAKTAGVELAALREGQRLVCTVTRKLPRVLPPATQAAEVVAPRREPNVPPGWPGSYVPNFSDWRLGDIVLVHRSADLVGAAIQAAQAASRSSVTKAGSVCSHAAIYVGDGEVVDATVDAGVALRSVWGYCQTRAIQLRRLVHPSIPASDIADIAAGARSHIGEPYSVLQVIISKLVPGTVPVPEALYCSTMVGLVVAEATGVDLSSAPIHQPLHPGTLAAHRELQDVLLEWRDL